MLSASTRVKGNESMPLTLSPGPEVTSRQVAIIDFPAAAVGTLSRTRTQVDGLFPARVGKTPTRPYIDIVEEWGMQSFPASDPPANW
jgi:hypothetical protein